MVEIEPEEEIDVTVESGGGPGTYDYEELYNKPDINGKTLTSGLTSADLDISYNDLLDKPQIPAKTSQLENDSQYVNMSQLAEKASYRFVNMKIESKLDVIEFAHFKQHLQDTLEDKQGKLTAGTNITISEDNVISVNSQATPYTAGENITISEDNIISATDTKYTKLSEFENDKEYLTVEDIINRPSYDYVNERLGRKTDNRDFEKHIHKAHERLNQKQDKLTAGLNITISEDNVISATGGGEGTSDYNALANKPFLNGVEFMGSLEDSDLNIQHKLTAGENITITDNVISATSGKNYDEIILQLTQRIENLEYNLIIVNQQLEDRLNG